MLQQSLLHKTGAIAFAICCCLSGVYAQTDAEKNNPTGKPPGDSTSSPGGGQAAPDVEPPDGIYTERQVTQKAVILAKPQAEYTDQAREKGVEGTLVLRIALMADGKIGTIRAITRLPEGLTEQAVAAARRIRFRPAKKAGKDVSQWLQFEYKFFLYDYIAENSPLIAEPLTYSVIEQPEYTIEARQNKTEGAVILDMGFDQAGRVKVLSVIKPLPYGLLDKALDSAQRIKFTPARDKKGNPLSIRKAVTFTFNLH